MAFADERYLKNISLLCPCHDLCFGGKLALEPQSAKNLFELSQYADYRIMELFCCCLEGLFWLRLCCLAPSIIWKIESFFAFCYLNADLISFNFSHLQMIVVEVFALDASMCKDHYFFIFSFHHP